ncbi:MAG: ubiquinone/menaquinone biosynthesis methyltransferase [Polyangiaceae bacterium]|nr:ubiquinone/menaquinone biosynthesis methyltransferase [Polyangiaceae bacterium]
MTSSPVRPGSGAMFDAIAGRYDLLNRIISLGVDQPWRRRLIASIQPRPGHRVLDLATGTGDVGLMLLDLHPEVKVVGLDPSAGMLDVARGKIGRGRLDHRMELILGEAERLPFEDSSFDGCMMAFGIRNVADRPAALREMARVVRPGGRVAILELSEPRSGVLGPLARFHIHRVVPTVGALLSGAREYSYLQSSIAAFPPPEVFAAQMREAGLDVLSVVPMTFGSVCLYVASPAPSV